MLTFPPSHRLLKSREYRFVFDDNRRHADAIAVVMGRPSGRDHARLGITVSKKVSKRAVDRNRIKRQIRESFRAIQSGLKPLDYVVIARGRSAKASNADIREAMARHWTRFASD